MKRIILLVLIGIFLLALVGCAKVINTEIVTVDATIIESSHQGAWIQPVIAGKFRTFIHHPEQNIVKIQYKDIVISVNDRELYNYYKGRNGETIECNLITKYFDNNTTYTYLEVKENESTKYE